MKVGTMLIEVSKFEELVRANEHLLTIQEKLIEVLIEQKRINKSVNLDKVFISGDRLADILEITLDEEAD